MGGREKEVLSSGFEVPETSNFEPRTVVRLAYPATSLPLTSCLAVCGSVSGKMFPPVQDPCESLRDESFFQSLPSSGLELIPQGHDDYGRVVVAAGFIRHQDKAIGYGGEIL